MKRFSFVLGVCALAMTLLLSTDAMAQKKKVATVWPAGDIKWEEMKDGPPGVKTADLWGNMMKGAYGTLVIFPAGQIHPLHSHSYDTKVIVISGTFLYTAEGGTEQRLGAGSYLLVPGGVKHTSGSGADGPCEIFQESAGKFDMHMVETGMMKK